MDSSTYALPSALVDVLSAHGLEGVGAAYEKPVGVVAVLLDDAQVILALPNLLALQEMILSLSPELIILQHANLKSQCQCIWY